MSIIQSHLNAILNFMAMNELGPRQCTTIQMKTSSTFYVILNHDVQGGPNFKV